jgi:VWFA-related protein
MARDPDARVFVIFMDLWHVQLEGSYHAQAPITTLLNRVIGQDDLLGVMTPDMAARNVTLARRPETIEGIFKNHWYWGQRGRINAIDPREEEIKRCYPEAPTTAWIAQEMIRRRREIRTLNALEDLILHLEGVREERKFVLLLSEGWRLGGPDARLSDVGGAAPPPTPVGVDPSGRLRMDPDRGNASVSSCERERSLLAFTDLTTTFNNLIQRANRANVSFYPLDPRGLVAFDAPIGPEKPPPPSVDAAILRQRYDALRTIAENSDGYAILNTNATGRALERMIQDTDAYYLLGYYSTNTKLDGRYRKLTVRVKRPGADVRARPGYLAPTEAELASTRVDALMNGAPPGHTTIQPSIARAFAGLGPVRGTMPFRVQSTASPSQIWITGELDLSTVKSPDWQKGGRVRASFEHERGASPQSQSELELAPGQRSFHLSPPPGATLVAGRYIVRLELLAANSTVPIRTTADVVIPEADWLLSASGLVARRGPSTGLQYVPTADARFRRTERMRLEIPRSAGDGQASARLLGRDGLPLNLVIALSERNEGGQRMLIADLTLAPLAQGDYAVEVTVEQGERKESATYAFRVIP